jgi:hypothetical protein
MAGYPGLAYPATSNARLGASDSCIAGLGTRDARQLEPKIDACLLGDEELRVRVILPIILHHHHHHHHTFLLLFGISSSL